MAKVWWHAGLPYGGLQHQALLYFLKRLELNHAYCLKNTQLGDGSGEKAVTVNNIKIVGGRAKTRGCSVAHTITDIEHGNLS